MAHPRLSATLAALIAASLVIPATADARKKKKDTEEEVVEEVVTDTPDDANSKKFAKNLIAAEIENFAPTDAAMSAKFIYETMSFNADNTWVGKGYVEIIDERMECAESGKWTMEPAESDSVATVNWSVEKTDCGGREAGTAIRAKVTITKDGGIEVLFR